MLRFWLSCLSSLQFNSNAIRTRAINKNFILVSFFFLNTGLFALIRWMLTKYIFFGVCMGFILLQFYWLIVWQEATLKNEEINQYIHSFALCAYLVNIVNATKKIFKFCSFLCSESTLCSLFWSLSVPAVWLVQYRCERALIVSNITSIPTSTLEADVSCEVI